MGEEGFVLPLALVVMVLLSMITAAGLYSSRNDLRAALAAKEAALALIAADAGANRTVALWNLHVPALPLPGDSIIVDWQALPDGSTYRSTVFRPPVGPDETPTTQMILYTTGQSPPPSGARRTIATVVEASGTGFGSICCDAAFKVSARMRISGADQNDPIPELDGTDRSPPGWAGSVCPASTQDLPGVLTSRARDIDVRNRGDVDGDPPIVEDPSVAPSDFLNLGGGAYSDLAASADISFIDGQNFRSGIQPAVANGECDTSVLTNWGDPLAPGGLCGDYFPLIHVAGNLRLSGSQAGQGVLLVDGNLQIRGDFQFFGVIVVLGTVTVSDDGRIFGAVLARGNANGRGRSQISDRGKILYSSCSVQRAQAALSGGSGSSARYWVEVMR
jgi:type II secretory pathway pseudopilin PulG